VSLYIHEAFKKPIESSPNFSKTNRVLTLFPKVAREFQYIHPTIRKRAQKICKKIQPIEKRNQAVYARAFFENSSEIQKLFALIPCIRILKINKYMNIKGTLNKIKTNIRWQY